MRYGEIELEGPFSMMDELRQSSGVAVLLCWRERSDSYQLLQIAVASDVATEVKRMLSEDWTLVCDAKLRVAVHYADANSLDALRTQVLWASDTGQELS